ncbi:hypothetical protein MTR67_044083 [Solanum verrucosum]|uniref:Uncharacterized protein n=1 Tax=Solanum verrucosum TaxID=315347 RepID=A0AAF0USP4_SOLVR|nr:hypothetical protein MTR67_044083 [Solanum verrucosum]
MLISFLMSIIIWTCSLTCLSMKSKKLKGKLVNIVVMPATLLEGFIQNILRKRHSLYDTLLKSDHLT